MIRAERDRLLANPERVEEALRVWLDAVERQEPHVQAWTWFDPEAVRAQARSLAEAAAGPADVAPAVVGVGDRVTDPAAPSAVLTAASKPLFGLPVGIKDIIDTADMPTENGTVLHAGRQPGSDAVLVQRLRAAGAVIMGKTVTTELATYAPGKTRNPHRYTHTPGGSSSGSAAAVACGMVPLAIGTQTNGSTIRPGAFCGVVSFKPTRSRIDRRGVLVQSPSFDTVGLFAREVDGVALLYEALAEPGVARGGATVQPAASAPPLGRLGWFPSPLSSRLMPGIEALLADRARSLGAVAMPADLAVPLVDLIELHRLIMEAEIARCFDAEYRTGAVFLSASLRGQIERGRLTTDAMLAAACRQLMEHQAEVDQSLESLGLDGWITASAPGPAPEGLTATGDPIFCTAATALDLPALQLPGLTASNGLPVGIQVVGRRHSDTALLAWAQRAHSLQPAPQR